LTLGIDDLIRAISHGPTDTTAGGTLEFTPDGSVVVGDEFRRAEAAWHEGLAAMARAGDGVGIIIDEVFLAGRKSQARLQSALKDLPVVWVGVLCQPEVAEGRERERADRHIGMARHQSERVHGGVAYDVVVDTSDRSADECALAIVAWMQDHECE
jgi:chloramphenicol 3-O phosphotransferase